jgi:hypothetical protein
MTGIGALRLGAGSERGLIPCPFCGSAPALEAHALDPDIVRIACRGDGCRIRPATEYLLLEYAHELRSAWNARSVARRRPVARR